MEHLGDVGHVESHLFLFSDCVSVAQKSFWMHSLVPLGDKAQVEACFGLSDIVLILTQDRCMVSVECTIGSEIILDAPDRTPR
jgi:hypothetical protein